MVEMNSEKSHTYQTSNVVASNLCTSRSRVLSRTHDDRSLNQQIPCLL